MALGAQWYILFSYDANADESRYLVDPERAAQYQQAFLINNSPLWTGLFQYDAALAGWNALLPGIGTLLIVGLVALGLWPQTAEYR
jgi:hypothetical protein